MAGDDWVEDVGSTTCAFGVRGGDQSAPSLGDGHFGHVRFKFFLKIDFDGHLVGGDFCVFWWMLLGVEASENDVHSHWALKGLVVNIALAIWRL